MEEKIMKIYLVDQTTIYAYSDIKTIDNYKIVCVEEDTYRGLIIPLSSISYIDDGINHKEEVENILKEK